MPSTRASRSSQASRAAVDAREHREALSRAAVLVGAVALADAEGIDAVSMRRLAERLGVVPMALYKHVADKEDLLDGMVDAVIGEFALADAAGASDAAGAGCASDADGGADWRARFTRRVLAARAAVLRHPWARRAIESRTVRTPAVLDHMEALTGHLLAGGLSPDLAHHAMHALGNRIWGFSPELFDESAGPARSDTARPRTTAAPDPTAYPAILAVAADATARRPGAVGCDEDFEFAFALEVILDGIARLHAAGWSSPAR